MLYTWSSEISQHSASSLETTLICANYNLCKNLSRLTREISLYTQLSITIGRQSVWGSREYPTLFPTPETNI